MRVLPSGDCALLVELSSLAEVLALFHEATGCPPQGIREIVPAARTLLVQFDPEAVSASAISGWVRGLSHRIETDGVASVLSRPSHRVEIPVRYTGEDLEEVAGMLGLSPAQVIERHTGRDYLAAFTGFAPGFVYLTGGDPCFAGTPRRAVPRTRVPAGSVAIGGDFSAVYPSDSPGGWRLLGVTPLRMWDLDRDAPALLQPGFGVRFRDLAAPGVHYSLPNGSNRETRPPAREDVRSAGEDAPHAGNGAIRSARGRRSDEDSGATSDRTWFEVLTPGPQTLFQDCGRPGMTALGVSGSGALDRASMAAANRLAGNPPETAVLENVWGGLTMVCHGGQAVVAVTGAPVAVVLTTASGMRIPAAGGSSLLIEDGQTLRLGRPRAGMRCYVAVRGGWDVPPVLGSRSTDVLSGIGPAIVSKGSRLKIADPTIGARAAGGHGAGASNPGVDAENGADPARLFPRSGDRVLLDIVLGPRDDWFDAPSLDRLQRQDWTVTPQSNRVGLRLEGEQPMTRAKAGELPSEGMVAGAIEVPPSGQPVLFLADHPLTGGYPVVAVAMGRGLNELAQVSPGVRLKFRVA